MTTFAEYYKIHGERVAQSLNQVREKLAGIDGEAVLDFSAVLRIDTSALHAIEELAALNSAKVSLRGVNVGVYKVLKLARLTSRLTFVN